MSVIRTGSVEVLGIPMRWEKRGDGVPVVLVHGSL